ncbi:MAG: alcohol dehydrogenase catalytic domain-containing protein, partial [Pseudomonadota bacterium]
MRALVCNQFGPPESLTIEEWDDPVPGDEEVCIDVAAAGVNFPDILSIAGQYQVKSPLPFIPGNEAAGVVTAVGANCQRTRVGDRIIVATRGGAFAEKCVCPEVMTMPLPDTLDFAQGAGFSVTYGTSYHALKQSANLQPDETLLVLGAAGGV